MTENNDSGFYLPAFVGIATDLFSAEHLVDYRPRTADSRTYGHCPQGAIALARATFYTGVTQDNLDLSIGTPKDLARAD